MLDQTDGDITLWGVNGEQVPLSRPATPLMEGLGLRSIPDGLSGFAREHLFDESTGVWRGMVLQPHQIRLDLIARGRYPRQYVDEFLAALGVGDEACRLSVASPERGVWSKELHYREMSELNWHGHTLHSPLVEFSVLLEAGKPGWQRDPQTLALTHESAFGWVELPVLGDMDVWPRFTITGGHEGVSVRLHEADDTQTIPHSTDGWVIDSRPDHRVVASLNGVQDFQGFVPFWPEPARNRHGKARVEVLVTNPHPNFEMTITWTPEATRGW